MDDEQDKYGCRCRYRYAFYDITCGAVHFCHLAFFVSENSIPHPCLYLKMSSVIKCGDICNFFVFIPGNDRMQKKRTAKAVLLRSMYYYTFRYLISVTQMFPFSVRDPYQYPVPVSVILVCIQRTVTATRENIKI